MQRERMIFPNERPAHTPWGVADYAREYAEGIVFYGTPSHGGFKLSAQRLARMHPATRSATALPSSSRGGWRHDS